MGLRVRRVVTGHDANGRAIITRIRSPRILREAPRLRKLRRLGDRGLSCRQRRSDRRRHAQRSDVGAERRVFRIVRYEPGVAPRPRTNSLDYGIILSGEIDMELEKGNEIHLKAGDVVVQRGTIHNWIPRGSEPYVIAFILTSAKPLSVGGKTVAAFG